ncbi:MAG: nucleotidyltransferase substrate binding protein, partial [Patescibacteria group bacterium]|nr:nucleotidyltransferase substrate binding protein [Patescibacteria group bacterium]
CKDYLEDSGVLVSPVTPRQVIKEAFAARVIDDGQAWIDMMLHRNLLSHTYDFSRFREVLDALKERYLAMMGTVHDWFAERMLE